MTRSRACMSRRNGDLDLADSPRRAAGASFLPESALFPVSSLPGHSMRRCRMPVLGLLLLAGVILSAALPDSPPDPFAPCRELRPGHRLLLVDDVWVCEAQAKTANER